MKFLFLPVLLFSLTASFGQFPNIKIDERAENNYACEPSIAINPKNPKNIVAASVKDNVYVSIDGGLTWDKKKIVSPLGVYGDPVVIADSKGTFFYFHLSDPTGEGWKNEKSLDQIVCHVSEDGGKTWDNGYPIGYNPPKDQDKPWATTDSKGNVYVAWTQFDKYMSEDPACESRILLSTSSNGRKWEKPVVISQAPGNCLDDDKTVSGGMPAISDDKRMYVTWAQNGKIFMDRSFDGGNMWLTNDIEVVEQPGGWDYKIPGHDRSNGLPMVVLEKTKSERKGLLFISWADQRAGVDNTDVFLIRSNNFGDNWTLPVKVNSDTGKKHQYMPSMVIDNVTGYIYVLFYDRRNYDDNQTDVYLAYSVDSGTTFKDVKISDTSFVPEETSFFGDYIQVAAHKGVIAAVWTRMDSGKTSVMSSVFTHEQLTK